MQRTLFSFEVPINNLTDFSDLQDFHFALSTLYQYPRYKQFFVNERKQGLKTIWIDNSYNERMVADSALELSSIFHDVGATRLISPDDPSWDTNRIKTEYLYTCSVTKQESVICVVNSPEMLRELQRVGAMQFALSYWVRSKLSSIELYQMSRCHFLGLLSINEIRVYQPPSCDTSMPIKLALKDQTLREWVEEGCPHINTKDLGKEGKDFFLTEMSQEQVDLARQNIIRLKEVCNEK